MYKTAMAASTVLALALAPAGVLAQEEMSDDMSGDDMMMGSMEPRPSHIHAGDCSMPGDVIVGVAVRSAGCDASTALARRRSSSSSFLRSPLSLRLRERERERVRDRDRLRRFLSFESFLSFLLFFFVLFGEF